LNTVDAVLQKRRADRADRVFLTGGTGFLGSHIAVELLRAGYHVCLLARPNKRSSAEERVARLMDWFGLDCALRQKLRVVSGAIELPSLGLSSEVRVSLLKNVDEIIHCASNTSFSERKRPEVEAANIVGLSNILSFAAESGCSFFHHVSTAFVAGKKDGLCCEELVDLGEFNNVYEETKARGERMAWDFCRREGIRLSIYRPSIIYGDSRTGRSLRFNAVYFPVKIAVFLKNLYELDLRERGGEKAELLGIRMESDGRLFMPIRIEVRNGGGINLIPIDYFVAAFMALLAERPDGGIFHIVNPRVKKIEDLIDYAKRLFRLKGIKPCAAADFYAKPKNALEILYESHLEAYAPYMRDKKAFDSSHARPVLEKYRISCPEFDYDVFARCMNYAVEVDWNARLPGK